MENHFQSKYFLILGVVLIIVGGFYLLNLENPETIPTAVLVPENYPTGTTVSVYENAPPGFPKEIILENKELDYSGTVVSPEGKVQISVSYISDKSMEEVADLYDRTLPSLGWTVTEQSIYEKVSIVQATKRGQNVLLSIVPLEKGGAMVTFQYEK